MLFLSGLLFATMYPCIAQTRLSGRVVDDKTNEPIPFASVGIIGTARGTSTNGEGEFSILLSDTDTLKVTCVGYQSRLVRPTQSSWVIRLQPSVTQLRPVLVAGKKLDARDVLQKAFKNVPQNFNARDFNQRFFYRHYCRDDSVYGRLIEAAVEVHKKNGYRIFRPSAGEREQIRVLQLRRSFDRTRYESAMSPSQFRPFWSAMWRAIKCARASSGRPICAAPSARY